MTTTIREGDGASAVRAGRGGDGPRVVPRRSPTRIPGALLGVLLILGSALVFAVLYTNAGERRPVLAVARPVPAGKAIQAADLKSVRVSAEAGLATLPARARDEVVGRTAAGNLVPGSLLARGQLSSGRALEGGRAVVGVALKPGQAPAGLQPGDRVMVVRTGASPAPATASSDEPAGVLARGATVSAVDRVAEAQAINR